MVSIAACATAVCSERFVVSIGRLCAVPGGGVDEADAEAGHGRGRDGARLAAGAAVRVEHVVGAQREPAPAPRAAAPRLQRQVAAQHRRCLHRNLPAEVFFHSFHFSSVPFSPAVHDLLTSLTTSNTLVLAWKKQHRVYSTSFSRVAPLK